MPRTSIAASVAAIIFLFIFFLSRFFYSDVIFLCSVLLDPYNPGLYPSRLNIITVIKSRLPEPEAPSTVRSAVYFFRHWSYFPTQPLAGFTPKSQEGKSCKLHHHGFRYQELLSTRIGPAILGKICFIRSFPVLLPESFAAIKIRRSFSVSG